MKVVILLAGQGRRLGELTRTMNKAMIKLSGKPLLGHLVERFLFCGLTNFVPILGHGGKQILDYLRENFKDINITPVYNPQYLKSNNLYSLCCASELLTGEDFLLCNGDVILNKFIIKELLEKSGLSAIAIDDSVNRGIIDSPSITVRGNRIYDLGRHILSEESGGYAIGLYKFNKEFSSVFFSKGEQMLSENINAGFHDPLINLFSDYPVFIHSTNGLAWTDIDTKEDIPYAQKVLHKIIKEESSIIQNGIRTGKQ